MKLTEHFTLAELTATSHGENTPGFADIDRLRALCVNVLEPLRQAYGHPLYINSGYRSQRVNKLVGGVATSQHVKGMAADISTRRGKAENEKLFKLAIELDLPFDQLIDENGYAWLHVSYNQGVTRKDVLHI